jgi:Yip1-like protein
MNLVDRAKNILMKPKDEWAVIAGEEPDTTQLVVGYMLPMAAIPFVGTIIGSLVLGELGLVIGIATGLVGYLVSVCGTFITALIVNALSTSFNSEKDFGRALQLVVYGSTGSWVGGIFNLLPFIGWLGSLAGGFYSIYLIYLGFPHTMKTPEDKVVPYMIVTVLILVVLYFILAAIIGIVIFGIIAAMGFGAASMFSM